MYESSHIDEQFGQKFSKDELIWMGQDCRSAPEPSDRLKEIRMVGKYIAQYFHPNGEKKLTNLQKICQRIRLLGDDVVFEVACLAIESTDERIRGEICYGLGRSGREIFKTLLMTMAHDPHEYVRGQALPALDELSRSSLSSEEAATPDPFADWKAYDREKERLRVEHPQEYAVICEGNILAIDLDRHEAIRKARQEKPYGSLLVVHIGVDD